MQVDRDLFERHPFPLDRAKAALDTAVANDKLRRAQLRTLSGLAAPPGGIPAAWKPSARRRRIDANIVENGRLLTIRLWDSGVRLAPGGQEVYLGQVTEEILIQRLAPPRPGEVARRRRSP